MRIIEITKEVYDEILNEKLDITDKELGLIKNVWNFQEFKKFEVFKDLERWMFSDDGKIPMEKFTLRLPYNFFTTEDEMMEDFMNSFVIRNSSKVSDDVKDKANMTFQALIRKNVELTYEVISHQDIQIVGKVYDANHLPICNGTESDKVFSVNISSAVKDVPTPFNFDLFGVNSYYFLSIVMRMYIGVLQYLKEPVRYVKKQEQHKKNKRANGKSKKTKTTYVKRTVYLINGSDNELRRQGHHVINMESWSVRGHWRHYKTGSKTWIKEHRKGKQKDDVVEEKLLKITNLNQ